MTLIYFPNEKDAQIKLSTVIPGYPTGFLLEMLSLPENRLDIKFLEAFISALNYVDNTIINLPEDKKHIGGFLITSSTGKFYCNGFNVTALSTQTEIVAPLLRTIVCKLLTFRVMTIAAMNGHAFGGGCVEIDLGMGLQIGTTTLIKQKVKDAGAVRRCTLMGHRYTADEAVKDGLVDYTADPENLLDAAVELGKQVSKKALNRGEALMKTKAEMYKDVIIYHHSEPLDKSRYQPKL
ncbi:Enoyl-CoA delta isomerase 1, peroxisomal [Zancudomyces culisetae]|uniref:Enoyl-CoA delta isomerase 1, peroxisomal n=1 Tax=Zancudomyces culisetae TaxID=1213189 RepID=A0A1R1PRF8_ZANCU|nr:Enoyl-CoA delta isomerase 1, peroxisomal [Zancudomyces culisetae]|eukprot:OMH83534.1 Enoyl-CoA delta isomerase 1, peroxisomal [Zancudomyces culisetae]